MRSGFWTRHISWLRFTKESMAMPITPPLFLSPANLTWPSYIVQLLAVASLSATMLPRLPSLRQGSLLGRETHLVGASSRRAVVLAISHARACRWPLNPPLTVQPSSPRSSTTTPNPLRGIGVGSHHEESCPTPSTILIWSRSGAYNLGTMLVNF